MTDQIVQNAKQPAFWRSVFSDGGEPSSSRVFTAYLVLIVSSLLSEIVYHVCKLTDPAILGLWLTALPYLVGVLIAFMTALYFVNRGSVSVTEVLGMFKKPQWHRSGAV